MDWKAAVHWQGSSVFCFQRSDVLLPPSVEAIGCTDAQRLAAPFSCGGERSGCSAAATAVATAVVGAVSARVHNKQPPGGLRFAEIAAVVLNGQSRWRVLPTVEVDTADLT